MIHFSFFRAMRHMLALAVVGFGAASSPAWSGGPPTPQKITVVLVHGAFAESSSWNDVIRILSAKGYPVVAVGNPLRSVKADAAEVSAVVASINGPVVLVGHSYGGSVISNVSADAIKVKALVFVAAFAPEAGESAAGLSAKFPGSTLKEALAPPVPLRDGGVNIFIRGERFHDQFAADVPAKSAALMAATQRPITEAALGEGAGDPIWKSIPSWFVYGDQDRNIPSAALAYMAERANSRETVVVRGGSHVVMVSQPKVVATLIEHAAQNRQ
jgi:pimeloyl-ACP methyl ester carboxylesterase